MAFKTKHFCDRGRPEDKPVTVKVDADWDETSVDGVGTTAIRFIQDKHTEGERRTLWVFVDRNTARALRDSLNLALESTDTL